MTMQVVIKGVRVHSQHYAGYMGDRWLNTMVDTLGRVYIWSTTYEAPAQVNYTARVVSIQQVGGTEVYVVNNCKPVDKNS